MSASSAVQKQHQKVLRNLMKLSPNKKCCDCGEQCAVQVDTTNGIFLCSICSGLHRDFGFRVKSVSMASFTQEEISKLQSMNNEEFNKIQLGKWKASEDPFPSNDDSNYTSRSAFLRKKYVDKVWYSKKAAGAAKPAPQAEAERPPAGGQGAFIFPQQGPAQPQAQGQPAAQWSPFGGEPERQQQAPPAQPKNDLDDLLNFSTVPQKPQSVEARNDVKDLLGMFGPAPVQPTNPNLFGQPQNQAGFNQPQPKNQGGFGAPQNPGGFGTPQNQGGFGTPQNQGGFGAPQNQGGFGAPQNQGGYGAPQNQGGFGAQQNQGVFRNQPNQGGFGAPQNRGGFGNQGGFRGPQNQGGFGSPQNQGGFNSPQNQGGYAGNQPNRQGFGNQPQNQGGFGFF